MSRFSVAGRQPPRPVALVILMVLPVLFVVASLTLRGVSGPFWMWFNLDPDYFYLFDSLKLVNLMTPGHVAHPGTTVQTLGALVLKAGYPTLDAATLTATVLGDPEFHLRRISTTLVGLNAAALAVAGVAGYVALRSLVPALLLQTAPFLSMLILKHGFHVKPESLLIFAMLALFVVVVLALRTDELERHRWRYAAAFGIVAGFAIATKITAAPAFIMPILLLGGFRAIAVFGLACLVSFVVFTLPAVGAYEEFLAWNWKVLKGSGAYDAGTGTVIDIGRYPASLLKLLRRPVLSVVLVLSLASVFFAWRRRRADGDPGLADVHVTVLALAGVCMAQVAQVLVVAKQPAAHYMIPAYMLSALSLALLYRLLGGLETEATPGRVRVRRGFALVLAALVAAQTFAVIKENREFDRETRRTLAMETDRFGACSRIYFYSASSLSYALLLADHVTGGTFAEQLQARIPDNDFWFEDWYKAVKTEIRDTGGPVSAAAVLDARPCLMIRGTTPVHALNFLKEAAPGLIFDGRCPAGRETVLVRGVGCDGAL